jgi:GntR family galactonate operon transcriptional repressor
MQMAAVGEEEVQQAHQLGRPLAEARPQLQFAQQQHADECCPNLRLHRVGREAHKGFELLSLLDRHALNGLVGQDKPDRKLLLALQGGRLIGEPAAAALALALATGKDRQRIHAALAAMEASNDQATRTAADKALQRAILDATHNAGGAGLSWRDPHDPQRGSRVTDDSVDGWFEDNLATMPTPPAPPKKATPKKPPCHGAGPWLQTGPGCIAARRVAGRRSGRPGGSRGLRKK